MMKTLTVSYPDTLEAVTHLSSAAFQARARMAMAVKLYELGTLTSGQAAALAGVSRVEFDGEWNSPSAGGRRPRRVDCFRPSGT